MRRNISFSRIRPLLIQFLLILILGLSTWELHAQSNYQRRRGRKTGGKEIHLARYDRYFLHYGFLMGAHSSRFSLRYADAFASTDLDTLHSIHGSYSGGFKVGMVMDFRLLDQLGFRILPTVGFYENKIHYYFTTETERDTQVRAYSLVEFPLLLKYKSLRRGNLRMYIVAGINPAFEARIRRQEVDNLDGVARILTVPNHISAEIGTGFDIYLEYFKFSSEIRYSSGLSNILSEEVNIYTRPIKRLVPHHLTLYLSFEGGPRD
ncbi:MAG: porin family protein [Cytophagales bacterium]|nr:porin family protein [Cytophagales bacterium]